MIHRRRIIWYAFLFLLAGGLLFWQWRTEPDYKGERLGNWLSRVHDPDPSVRAEAATALGALGNRASDTSLNHDGEKAWKELATMSLYDADDQVRNEAVKALASLCQTPSQTNEAKRIERKRTAEQSLLDGFKIGNVEVRRRVPEVVYEVTGLEFYEHGIRRVADDAVDKEMRSAAVTALIRALKDTDEEVREEAVRYLGKVAKIPVEAEPALLELLQVKNTSTRIGAALALSNLQRISDAAIPGLVVAAQDDSPDVRLLAFHCLIRIGPKVAPALKEALAKTNDEARRAYLKVCLKAFALKKAG